MPNILTIRLRFQSPIFNDLKNRIQRVCSGLFCYRLFLTKITSHPFPFLPLPSLLLSSLPFSSLPSFTYFDSYYIFPSPPVITLHSFLISFLFLFYILILHLIPFHFIIITILTSEYFSIRIE